MVLRLQGSILETPVQFNAGTIGPRFLLLSFILTPFFFYHSQNATQLSSQFKYQFEEAR
jgi:hypothetical protein